MGSGEGTRALEPAPGRGNQLSGAPQSLPGEVNQALVPRLYQAAVQADLATARRLFAEGVWWQVPGPEPTAGP
jgi:hypothetical protein